MSKRTQLSVNVDHVATLRQARGVDYPDPVEAAAIAESAGASGITVHLRGDRRHIQDDDVERLRRTVVGKLNLEMAASGEMLEIALRRRPQQVTLVPERLEEVTTEGGLDLATSIDRVNRVAHSLAAAGIAVSLFLDPDLEQVERASTITPAICGIELNTDRYTRAAADLAAAELGQLSRAAGHAASLRLAVYAGHGLTASNVAPVAALPEVEELNIGHWLVSRSVLIGMAEAVREMLAAMRGPSG